MSRDVRVPKRRILLLNGYASDIRMGSMECWVQACDGYILLRLEKHKLINYLKC